jgi:death-on-curing protein
MMEPHVLSLAQALRVHRSSIDAFGGDPGVRDLGLLESAVAQPRAAFGGQYLHDGIPAMAAAYLFHIVSNHPSIDGNKRTGALASYVFLQINGLDFDADENTFTDVTLAVARGEMSKEELIDFFRQHVCE